jgi:hypothetical protein
LRAEHPEKATIILSTAARLDFLFPRISARSLSSLRQAPNDHAPTLDMIGMGRTRSVPTTPLESHREILVILSVLCGIPPSIGGHTAQRHH